MVNGQRSIVNGQLSIVNCQLSIKKKLCLSGGQAGLCVLFSQINSIFSQKARCYFLISEIVFLASETTT